MTRYKRGKRLPAGVRRMWRWQYGFGALTCLVICYCIFGAKVAQLVPQSFAFLDKHLPTNTSPNVPHSGSSGPPPQGVVSGAHTTTTSTKHAVTTVRNTSCKLFGALHTGLAASEVPELRKLAQYEQLCSGALAQRTSFFVPTPSTAAEAVDDAHDTAATLQAYQQVHILPLIFMEPADVSGKNLDLKSIANGTYDNVLDTYFSTLASAGVTSSSMGLWVYVPEGNLPLWSTTDPSTFGTVVKKLATLQKHYFPTSQASVMLDSESYPPGTTWGGGAYSSLVPYVKNIPKGLLNSVGLQGFPWAPPANEGSTGSLYDPNIYLRTDLAEQAAKTLGIKTIWCNTGTFGQKYSGQSGATVNITAARRQQMLDTVLGRMESLQSHGFSVQIHIFAQNKAATDEATDWSYWRLKPGDNATSTAVLTTFVRDATTHHIPIWLFDTY